MKTLVISSSFSPDSRSRILCRIAADRLEQLGADITFLDIQKMDIRPHWKGMSADMNALAEAVTGCDNIIFGMGVHGYSINDGLKMILDTCMDGAKGKFFGVLCAAGGEKSYMSTMALTTICMNEWRMIQLPRVVYAVKTDFSGDTVVNGDVIDRLETFSSEFIRIGTKLLS